MIIIDKVYGEQEIDNPLIIELIDSSELQRLKGVGQYGTWPLMDKRYDTTRFGHSFGVYCLLKRFRASFEEQVAGLLHDLNHTAFSHVVDYVLGDPSVQEFGDSKQKKIVMNSSIPAILSRYNIDVNRVCNPEGFGLLERELPDLCCDRLDYCLRDSLCCGFIDQQEAKVTLDGLLVYNGEIICNDKESAIRLGKMFLKTSRFLWSNEIQSGSFHLLAEAIKIAINDKVVREEDLYTSDDELVNQLEGSGNIKILEILGWIKENKIVLGTEEDHDIFSRSKVRYIDPKFFSGERSLRLSEVDENFKKEIDEHRKWVEKGFYIKIKK